MPASVPIVGAGSWHVNFVLFCFDGGQVPKRCLVSKFMSSMKCFDLLPQVHAQQGASRFWLSQSSKKLGKENQMVHHVLNKMLCPFTSARTRCRPFLASILFLWRRTSHTFSCLFLNENHELSRSRARQIDLSRQGLHSCDLLPCWLRSKVAGLA